MAGYGLSFAVGRIGGGRLGDLYGRRRLFTVGLALFTLTSAACGLALSAGFRWPPASSREPPAP